ncbi:MAG: GNAT family N-acetyltransferase [Ignavibacteriae bacterium]|nr:GNAT family N-acetyltransferase [Ignavibacteriota bacterium]MCB9214893.1 GNAT family N-acetyltransferase [Ignavibacteria bacterium]
MLETLRTTIRPYLEEDIVRILPIFSDPLTMQFWPEPFSRTQVDAWVKKNIERMKENKLARMIVESRETGEVIGDCGVVRAEIDGRTENDLGYIIHHPFWRQGYGTECAEALIAYFTEVRKTTLLSDQNRIVANMAVDHIGSRRVAERVGMELERTFLNKRNRGIETCLYVLQVGKKGSL